MPWPPGKVKAVRSMSLWAALIRMVRSQNLRAKTDPVKPGLFGPSSTMGSWSGRRAGARRFWVFQTKWFVPDRAESRSTNRAQSPPLRAFHCPRDRVPPQIVQLGYGPGELALTCFELELRPADLA